MALTHFLKKKKKTIVKDSVLIRNIRNSVCSHKNKESCTRQYFCVRFLKKHWLPVIQVCNDKSVNLQKKKASE